MSKLKVLVEELRQPGDPFRAFQALKDLSSRGSSQGRDWPYRFLLHSSYGDERTGRFSFLGCDPFLVFRSKRDSVTLEWSDGRIETVRSNPFHILKDILRRYSPAGRCEDMPFTSGAVGYFAYDLKDFVEELPDRARDDLHLPDCILGFYDTVIVCDNLSNKAYITSSGMPEMEPAKNAIRRESRLKNLKYAITHKSRDYTRRPFGHEELPLRSNFSKESYVEAIEKAKRYISKGDIYQVNLSQRFHARLNMDPAQLYERLNAASPAPFSSFLDFGDINILSSSPERFLLKRGRYIETRPIKGTAPRGKDARRDMALARELEASAKDRAEHIMIVDLERNDLGRICEYGSVRAVESFALERYSSVFHLVSTVAGRLKENVGPVDCLLAAFPGGSITGAPKIRSMEIIEELEPVKRSVYTGAIGYISFDGNMDTSIVIRTFVIKERDVYFQVGGGIVADSDPEKEYEETLHKAKGLLQALGANFSGPAARSRLAVLPHSPEV